MDKRVVILLYVTMVKSSLRDSHMKLVGSPNSRKRITALRFIEQMYREVASSWGANV